MQTVWNMLTIRCTRKLLKLLDAEAIVDPPSPTCLLRIVDFQAKSTIRNRHVL